MLESRISASELARTLSDVLNRVKYKSERFLVERNGEPVAFLSPALVKPGITPQDLAARIGYLRMPDSDFATDLEELRRCQGFPPETPWA